MAHLVHSNGAQRLEAELDPVMPWMGDGLRRFAGQDAGGAPVQASFAAGVCKRGGEVFSHRVELRLGERRYRGCARETGRALPWSADLPALMSPIEACVRDSARSAIAHVRGAAARRVAHARRDGGGAVVRLSYPGGARFDCAVTQGGRVTWRVVGPHEPPLPSEADPVFAPAFASGTAPRDGQGCYIYEHVHDAQGRVVGALGHDACAVGAPDPTG